MDREYIPVVAIACLMVIVQIGAVAIVNLYPQEYQAFGEDTDDPLNPLIYVGFIIIFTGIMLAVMKYTKGNFIQYAILGIVGLTIFYVSYPVLFYFIPYGFNLGSVGLDIPLIISIFLGISLTYTLYKFPEWYVVDSIGIVMGAGIAGIFGMSFGILPVFILLIVLAVYDFISVYKTKHMISLASGVMKMKLPVVLVIPKKLNYSFYQKEGIMQEIDKKKKRDAIFIGLGDLIIPGILAVSASYHLPGMVVAGIYAPVLVAFGCIIGSVIGMLALMRFVLKGNPQAGLPLLNTGAISGYILAYLIVYQNLTLGITYPW
ncbi:MAG: presenilin family intramembrane aspartyl protease PSH [Candidatus Saliniplasma sp.]